MLLVSDYLQRHESDVFCLQVRDNILATGSWDKTIELCDIRTRHNLQTLTGHTGGVYCLWFDDKYMISGCHQRDVIFWDMKTFELLRIVHPHQRGVRWLDSDGYKVATGSIDHSIQILDYNGTFPLTHCYLYIEQLTRRRSCHQHSEWTF